MDTLKYYDSLIDAGNTEKEARAHIDAFKGALGDLATKDDLRGLKIDLDYIAKSAKNDLDSAMKMLDVKISTQFSIIERVGGSFCVGIFLLLLKIAIWG